MCENDESGGRVKCYPLGVVVPEYMRMINKEREIVHEVGPNDVCCWFCI